MACQILAGKKSPKFLAAQPSTDSLAWRLHFAPRYGLFFVELIMPTIIETKTSELCQAILEEIQSNGIRRRIDTFMADPAARGQYESLMNRGQALQEKQHRGHALEPAEISAFERDREALLKNPVAAGFLDAQEEMHDIQHKVKKMVGKTVELGRIPNSEELAEGGCGHGCGCHTH